MRISDWSSDVCSSDLDDILVLGVQAAVLKLGHGIAKADAVGGSQIIERLHYAARADAGRLDVARLVDASGDQDRIMTLAQIVHGGVSADFEIDRKSVVTGMSGSERVDIGVRCFLINQHIPQDKHR